MLLSLVEAITSGMPSPLRVGMSPDELVAVLGSTELVTRKTGSLRSVPRTEWTMIDGMKAASIWWSRRARA